MFDLLHEQTHDIEKDQCSRKSALSQCKHYHSCSAEGRIRDISLNYHHESIVHLLLSTGISWDQTTLRNILLTWWRRNHHKTSEHGRSECFLGLLTGSAAYINEIHKSKVNLKKKKKKSKDLKARGSSMTKETTGEKKNYIFF